MTQEGTNTSEPSQGFRTGPEPPLAGPFVNATALNHTAVKVTWSPPATRLLRGSPQSYRVRYTDLSLPSKPVTVFGTVAGDVTNVIVVKLKPSTDYDFQVIFPYPNYAPLLTNKAFKSRQRAHFCYMYCIFESPIST